MKKIIFIVLFFISAGNSFAQQVTFQKTFGGFAVEGGFSAQQTTDGGYIIVGTTGSFGAGNVDFYLIKTNSYGDTLWAKTYGGTSTEYAYSVEQTSDSGFILAGTTFSFGVIVDDIYLVKTDFYGNELWSKTYGGAGFQVANSVKQTNDGGFIITGSCDSVGSGNIDICLIKTDSNGNLTWSKTIGDGDYDEGYFVQQTNDGGYIITGYTTNFAAGDDNVYLVKTDSIGNTTWAKTFGGITNDEGNAVQQTNDGGYIIAGETGSFGNGFSDVYLIKVDSSGDELWSKTFGGAGEDYANSISQIYDGGYIIAGETRSFGNGFSDVYLIKVDSSGDELWSKTFGGAGVDYANSISQIYDGGYIIAGLTESFGAGLVDVYLIKTDSMGNSGCNESMASTNTTIPTSQTLNLSPNVFIPSLVITIPATIVGSGGTVTTLCASVDIPSTMPNPQSAIIISPNPATNNFTITFPNTINKGVIEIYNVMGEKIFKEDVFNVSQKEVQLKNMEAGIYFVKAGDGEKVMRGKFLKE